MAKNIRILFIAVSNSGCIIISSSCSPLYMNKALKISCYLFLLLSLCQVSFLAKLVGWLS
jgi:hypothetical protein